jgi:hypothetical protein
MTSSQLVVKPLHAARRQPVLFQGSTGSGRADWQRQQTLRNGAPVVSSYVAGTDRATLFLAKAIDPKSSKDTG